MVISLILLFITAVALSILEEKFSTKHKVFLYIVMGIVMIFIAGLREVGSTPDTETYEEMYYGKFAMVLEDVTEPSFLIISEVLNSFSFTVMALFFTYAIISVPIHLGAFWRMSRIPLTTLLIYISYYYMMHEMVQIRAGVASALFLWAMCFYAEGRKWLSLSFVLFGTFFHYSAITGLVLFLMTDKLENWHKYILYSLIPVGLVAYFGGLDISYLVPETLGGDKLMHYRELKDSGIENDQAGWQLNVNLSIWMNFVLFYACIYYHDYIKRYCPYITISIKVQAIGFCCLFFLHGVSAILGNRLNDYFSVASVILWTCSVYGFVPRIAGKIINVVICTIRFVLSMLMYALSLLFM